MPKMKTKQSAAKRLRLTASGKLKHGSVSRGHLLGGKSRKRKRRLRKGAVLAAVDTPRIRVLLR